MKNLAPDIVRRRQIIEGFFTIDVREETMREYLLGLAAHLGLRTYAEPIVYAPESGMGRGENAGFDAFVPLIDSGISAYVWSAPRFFSVVIYTCKDFDMEAAASFTREFFKPDGEIAQSAF